MTFSLLYALLAQHDAQLAQRRRAARAAALERRRQARAKRRVLPPDPRKATATVPSSAALAASINRKARREQSAMLLQAQATLDATTVGSGAERSNLAAVVLAAAAAARAKSDAEAAAQPDESLLIAVGFEELSDNPEDSMDEPEADGPPGLVVKAAVSGRETAPAPPLAWGGVTLPFDDASSPDLAQTGPRPSAADPLAPFEPVHRSPGMAEEDPDVAVVFGSRHAAIPQAISAAAAKRAAENSKPDASLGAASTASADEDGSWDLLAEDLYAPVYPDMDTMLTALRELKDRQSRYRRKRGERDLIAYITDARCPVLARDAVFGYSDSSNCDRATPADTSANSSSAASAASGSSNARGEASGFEDDDDQIGGLDGRKASAVSDLPHMGDGIDARTDAVTAAFTTLQTLRERALDSVWRTGLLTMSEQPAHAGSDCDTLASGSTASFDATGRRDGGGITELAFASDDDGSEDEQAGGVEGGSQDPSRPRGTRRQFSPSELQTFLTDIGPVLAQDSLSVISYLVTETAGLLPPARSLFELAQRLKASHFAALELMRLVYERLASWAPPYPVYTYFAKHLEAATVDGARAGGFVDTNAGVSGINNAAAGTPASHSIIGPSPWLIGQLSRAKFTPRSNLFDTAPTGGIVCDSMVVVTVAHVRELCYVTQGTPRRRSIRLLFCCSSLCLILARYSIH